MSQRSPSNRAAGRVPSRGWTRPRTWRRRRSTHLTASPYAYDGEGRELLSAHADNERSSRVTAEEIQALLSDHGIHDPAPPLTGSANDGNGILVEDQPLRFYLEHEPRASVIREFASQLIPGPLRTERYIQSLLPEVVEIDQPLDGDGWMNPIATQRWNLLDAHQPTMLFILDESVVRRTVGGTAVMVEQIARIRQLAERSNVTVKMVPFSFGAYAGMRESFSILEFPTPGKLDLLYARGAMGEFVTTVPDVVRSYREIFELLTLAGRDV